MKKDAIIFDLDGTLWDACEPVRIAWNRVLQRNGHPDITLETITGFMGKTIDEITSMFFTTIPHVEGLKIALACCDEECRYLAEHGARLFDGLEGVLQQLCETYSLSIVSNCQDGYAEAFLSHYGFEKYFDDYEYSGRTQKPKGDNIKMLMERNGITRAVYVGDTQGDCDAAAQAGIPFVFARYGFGSVNRHDAVVSSVTEIPQAVAALFDRI